MTVRGAALAEHQIRSAFESAGYNVRSVILEPHHQIWIVRLRRDTAPKLAEGTELRKHVRKTMRLAGLRLEKNSELTAQFVGNRGLVAFSLVMNEE